MKLQLFSFGLNLIRFCKSLKTLFINKAKVSARKFPDYVSNTLKTDHE